MADTKPLPLENVLRDLAFLRASDVDPAATLNSRSQATSNADAPLIPNSFRFVQEARKAIRLHGSGRVSEQGDRIEDLRSQIEEVLKAIGSD